MAEAAAEKHRLEEKQRDKKRKNDAKNFHHTPLWFESKKEVNTTNNN
jgi:hypothetical protein